MGAGDELLYREVQTRKPWWVWILVVGLGGLIWTGFWIQIVLGRPVGTNPAPDAVMWILLLLMGVAFPAFVVSLRLIVEVRASEVVLRYIPLWRKRIPLGSVRGAAACQYQPIADYMGWGIRYMPGKGWAWTISGNQGVRLELAGERKLLIGSRRPDDLADAILVAASVE